MVRAIGSREEKGSAIALIDVVIMLLVA